MRDARRIFYILPLFYFDELCGEYAAILCRNLNIKEFLLHAELFACEAVCHIKAVAAKRVETYFIIGKHDILIRFIRIEEAYCKFAIRKMTEADYVFGGTSVVAYKHGRASLRILIYADKLLI